MGHARNAIMDPLPAALHHGLTDPVESDLAVVVASNGENGREFVEPANQLTKLDQREARSTRSPPSSTTSGLQRVADSNTCRQSLSERPFLR